MAVPLSAPTTPFVAELRLLGDVSVVRDDGGEVVLRRRQPRAALALLALERHRTVSRSEIADLLWIDELPPHWAGAVRGVVSKVRSFLEEASLGELLVTGAGGWQLDLRVGPGVSLDVERVRCAVEAAEASVRRCGARGPAVPDGVCVDAELTGLVAATSALADELAPGAQGLWVEQARDALSRLRRRGLVALVDLAGRVGRDDLAVEAADALLRADPYSDAAARALVEALERIGDRTGAVERAGAFESRLADELGVEPETRTIEVFATVRDGGRRRSATATPRSRPWTGADAAFVGRTSELGVLHDVWAEVLESASARAVLLLGEPGAGKTRLAAEVARGPGIGKVLWGRCSPHGRTRFDPVIEALERAGGGPSRLGPLVGGAVADAERGELFRELAGAVCSIADRPTVWVIDDVHWANEDTLALLAHLTDSLRNLPVLVVLTARATHGDVASMLETMAREVPTTTVHVRGLDPAAVADLLAAAGIVEWATLAERVWARTGGNPFFVHELVRAADADGRLDPESMPATLRSWINQRIAALGPGPGEVLAAASVLGHDLDLDVLAATIGRPSAEVLRDVEPLLVSGLLVEPDSEHGPDLAFAHALTRHAVDDGLARTRRHHLHAAVADAVLRCRSDARPADVATHLASAGPRADARAVPAMLQAGEEALAATAWSTASSWFEDVLSRRPDPGPERIDALIGVGAARRGLGQRTEARTALAEALETAPRSGSARQIALATLRMVGGGARGVADDLPDADRAALLRRAIGELGSDDDDLRIPLQLELALALLLTDRDAERRDLAEDALKRARSLGRDDLLGRALVGHRLAHHGPDAAERRLAEVTEVLAIDARLRSHDVTATALMSLHEDALLVGDRPRARAALAEAEQLVEAAGHPYWRWVVGTWHVLGAIIDGRLEDAEAAAFEAVALQAEHPEATACLGVNLVDIRLFQWRSGEVIDLLEAAVVGNPHIPAYRAVLALCLAEAGDLELAESRYQSFSRGRFEAVPDDTNRLLSLAVLADVAATIGDVDGALLLRDLLAPHATRQVVLNCFAGGGAYWGPVATQLGRLELLLGDRDAAVGHLAAARTSAEAFGAPLALARIPEL